MEFLSFCDSTSSRVENGLKPIELLIIMLIIIILQNCDTTKILK